MHWRHNPFSKSLEQSHTNIETFLVCLKRELGLSHLGITQDDAGMNPPLQKRKYRHTNTRVRNIVAYYDNHNRLEF